MIYFYEFQASNGVCFLVSSFKISIHTHARKEMGVQFLIRVKRKLPSKKKWLSSSFLFLLVCHEFCVGTKDFANQRHNLRGKPGQGYYIEVAIGTPPQKVYFYLVMQKTGRRILVDNLMYIHLQLLILRFKTVY